MARVCLDLWRQQRIDGCLLTAVTSDDDSLSILREEGLPFVLLGLAPGVADIPAVEVDIYAGARRITRLLLDLAHRRLAHIAGPQRLAGERAMQRGFLDEVASLGKVPEPSVVAGDATIRRGCQQLTSYIYLHP